MRALGLPDSSLGMLLSTGKSCLMKRKQIRHKDASRSTTILVQIVVYYGNHRETGVLQRNWEGTSNGVGNGPLRREHWCVLGDDKTENQHMWRPRPEMGAQHSVR